MPHDPDSQDELYDIGSIEWIYTLAFLGLPCPTDEDQIEALIADWIEAARDSSIGGIMMPKPLPTFDWLEAPEAAMHSLMALIAPKKFLIGIHHKVPENYREWEQIIQSIDRELRPNAIMTAHVHKILGEHLARKFKDLMSNARELRTYFAATKLSMSGETTVELPYGACLKLEDALASVNLRSLDLWHLREAFAEEDKVAFGEALWSSDLSVRQAIENGLRGLFDGRGYGLPSPGEYLAAFGSFLGEGEAIGIILSEVAVRASYRTGFGGGPDLSAWFETLAGLRGWTPEHARTLIHVKGEWGALAGARTRASLAAIEDLSRSDPGSAALCAFHLLHQARGRFELHGDFEDFAPRETLRERIGELPQGGTILALEKHLAALPLSDQDEDCVWCYLGKSTIGSWRHEVASLVDGDSGTARAVSEFLLASTPRDAYGDVEPLLLTLHRDESGIGFLTRLQQGLAVHVEGPAYLTALRAANLKARMLTLSP